jgi:uncharacterized protein YpmB
VCSKYLIIFKVLAQATFTITTLISHPYHTEKEERAKEKREEYKCDRMTERS